MRVERRIMMTYFIAWLFPGIIGEFLTQVRCENVNLALNRPATQSSTYRTLNNGFTALANFAVDGNADGEFKNRSCTHTSKEYQPWWQVDLGDKFNIHVVEITTRNIGRERLKDFKISTSIVQISNGESEIANPKLCFYQHRFQDIATVNYTCETMVLGRFVRVQLQGSGFLTLCEVRIFGYSKDRLSVFSTREKRRSLSYPVLSYYETRRHLTCLTDCISNIECTSVSVGWITERRVFLCELLQDLSEADIENETVDADWTHYVL